MMVFLLNTVKFFRASSVLLLFVLCFLNDVSVVQASHKVFPEYQSLSSVNVHKVHRTAFHFQPKMHWMNDPNGPVYYKGLYHLFYQYNPYGAVWGNIVWGHSVSKDMVNWETLEHALVPSKPFDKYGCWSGSITILPGDKPIILYTGIVNPEPAPGQQVQNYAIPANLSDPYLREWIKPDNNPVIVADAGVNRSSFRDPTTAWFDGGHWHTLISSRRRHRGMVYLYRSRDFIRWTRRKHPFHSKAGTGNFECADFYPVMPCGKKGLDTGVFGPNLKYVLKVSLDQTRYDYYTIGMYDRDRDIYIPDKAFIDGWDGLRYDYGNFYASKTFFDPVQCRRILWGWANESDPTSYDVQKGWAGIQLLPRAVWHDKAQLVQWPIEELETLRSDRVHISKVKLNKGTRIEVKRITAAQADIEVTFSFSSLDKAEPFDPSWATLPALDICAMRDSTVQGGLGPFGFLTLASDNMEEYTPVFFRVFKAQDRYKILMCSDARRSSLDPRMYKPPFAGYVNVDLSDKKLSLRTLVDHSVVESYGAEGRTVISSRVYPTLAIMDKAHLHVFNNGSEPVTLDELNAWSMKAAQMN